MRLMPIIFLVPLLLNACAQFPQVDASVSPEAEAADYPALLPLEDIATAQSADKARAEAAQQTVEARAARLRARAARLRGPVVDRSTRARMQAGVPRG